MKNGRVCKVVSWTVKCENSRIHFGCFCLCSVNSEEMPFCFCFFNSGNIVSSPGYNYCAVSLHQVRILPFCSSFTYCLFIEQYVHTLSIERRLCILVNTFMCINVYIKSSMVRSFESTKVSIPATGSYCLATLMSSDKTKQICL